MIISSKGRYALRVMVYPVSYTHLIEEREITLNDGEKINLQFVSTADMQKDAKDLSIKFLPYSLFISILFSAIISLIYAKIIKNNIQEKMCIRDRCELFMNKGGNTEHMLSSFNKDERYALFCY